MSEQQRVIGKDPGMTIGKDNLDVGARRRPSPARRSRGFVVAVCLALVALAGCNADWPMLGGGLEHTHLNGETNNIGTSGVTALSEAWAGTDYGTATSPVIANGYLYAGGTANNWPTSQVPGLLVFDPTGNSSSACTTGRPATCDPLWVDHMGTAGSSTPAVANGAVYVQGRDSNGHTSLFAFAVSPTLCTGTIGISKVCYPEWATRTDIPGSDNGSLMAPVVFGNTVFVGGGDGRLQAFDAATGQLRWKGLDASAGNSGGIAVDENSPAVVFITGRDAEVHAYAVGGCGGSVCSPRWSSDYGRTGSINDQPVYYDGMVYVTGNGVSYGVFGFDASGCDSPICSPVWKGGLPNSVSWANAQLAIAYDRVIVSLPGELWAFDSQCTEPKCFPVWTQSFAGSAHYGTPAIANHVLFAYCGGSLCALDIDTNGKQLKSVLVDIHGGDAGANDLTVANGIVYFATVAGIRAFAHE